MRERGGLKGSPAWQRKLSLLSRRREVLKTLNIYTGNSLDIYKSREEK